MVKCVLFGLMIVCCVMLVPTSSAGEFAIYDASGYSGSYMACGHTNNYDGFANSGQIFLTTSDTHSLTKITIKGKHVNNARNYYLKIYEGTPTSGSWDLLVDESFSSAVFSDSVFTEHTIDFEDVDVNNDSFYTYVVGSNTLSSTDYVLISTVGNPVNYMPYTPVYSYAGTNNPDDSDNMYATSETVDMYAIIYGSDEGATDTGTSDSIEFNVDEYYTGDTAYVLVNITNQSWDTGNYSYYLEIHDGAGLKDTQEITTQVCNLSYAFDTLQITSAFLARVKRQDGVGASTVLCNDVSYFYETDADYSIEFGDSSYRVGDTMTIYYSNLPDDSSVYLRGTDPDYNTVYSNTVDVSGSGTVSLTVPSNTADTYGAYALYDGYTLDSDFVDIVTDINDVNIYGVVYDANYGHPIDNAHVLIDGLGPYTDETGRYSIIEESGTHNMTISADGYQTQRYGSISFYVDTQKIIYLAPSSVALEDNDGALYGVVRDYSDGGALKNVLITVMNSTFSDSTLTSSTGYYEINGLVNGTSYSVYAMKEDYDNYYNSSVNISDGIFTWHEFTMISSDYAGANSTASTTEEAHEYTDEEMISGLRQVAWPLFQLIAMLLLVEVIK